MTAASHARALLHERDDDVLARINAWRAHRIAVARAAVRRARKELEEATR